MKILYVNALYPTAGDQRPIGGAETFSVRLVNGIRAAGHEVTVVRSGVSSQPSVEHTPEGVAIHSMPCRNIYPMADGRQHSAPNRLIWHTLEDRRQVAPDFTELLHTVQPDLIHTNNVVGLTSDVWRVASQAGVPILHTLHDYYVTCPNAMRFSGNKPCTQTCNGCALLSRRRRTMARNVDKVVGVSSRMLDIHRAEGVFLDTPSEIILNTPAPSNAALAMPPRPLGPVINFGYIGRQAVEKGIFDLLAAFTRLRPGTARLLIAGAINPAARDWVAQHAPQAGPGSGIEFIGYIAPDRFFPRIDVAVFPSLWEEPCSMGVGEAFSFGIPVLGSKRGGTPELVEGGRLGWLYEPEQPDALATLMARLVDDRAEIAAKAGAVRDAQDEGGGDRLVAAYLAAYDDAVAAHKAAA